MSLLLKRIRSAPNKDLRHFASPAAFLPLNCKSESHHSKSLCCSDTSQPGQVREIQYECVCTVECCYQLGRLSTPGLCPRCCCSLLRAPHVCPLPKSKGLDRERGSFLLSANSRQSRPKTQPLVILLRIHGSWKARGTWAKTFAQCGKSQADGGFVSLRKIYFCIDPSCNLFEISRIGSWPQILGPEPVRHKSTLSPSCLMS